MRRSEDAVASPHLLWKSVAAFLALPGTVAYLVPWLLLRPRAVVWEAGLFLIGIGSFLLGWCVRDFYVAGKGTLAPWAPPQRLVTIGLYRVSRNPMYVAVLVILSGWAMAYRSPGISLYAGLVAAAFHVRVSVGEEPWLATRHGEEWTQYSARVPRWLIRSPSSK